MQKKIVKTFAARKSQIEEIVQFYNQNGYVLIQLLDEETCKAMVLEQWREIILKQPYSDDYKLESKNYDNPEEAIDLNEDELFTYATKKDLTPNQLKKYTDGWPMHKTFGATCDPQVFNLKGVWKIRENKFLYRLAKKILNKIEIWVSIDRSIQKLPNQGENEWLHLDLNLKKTYENIDASSNETKTEALQGKVLYTEGGFLCVPGSHTPHMTKTICEQHVNDANYNKDKFPFNENNKWDQEHLFKKQKFIHIPAGCAIFWNSHLVHGVLKIPRRDNIQYGTYIGYFAAGSRPEYKEKTKALDPTNKGVSELQDRLDSYVYNRAPILWPSLDQVHYFPAMWTTYTQHMKNHIAKLHDRVRVGMLNTITQKNGKKLQVVTAPILPREQYQKPDLSELGKKLLGMKLWPDLATKYMAEDDKALATLEQNKKGDKAMQSAQDGIEEREEEEAEHEPEDEVEIEDEMEEEDEDMQSEKEDEDMQSEKEDEDMESKEKDQAKTKKRKSAYMGKSASIELQLKNRFLLCF